MAPRVSRPLDYAARFGIQQADQAIKKDVVRALVELITNSDDSYRRLESEGHEADGRISVDVQRRRSFPSMLAVTDYGEGMDGAMLDRAVGVYAEATSGFTAGAPVRGLFGRGIKDAILGLGEGSIASVVNGTEHRARLELRDGVPHYEAEDPMELFPNSDSDSTEVRILVTRSDIRIPQKDNLRNQLLLHYGLREILASDSREVVIRDLDPRGKPVGSSSLKYEYPLADQLNAITLTVPGFDVPCDIVLHRSHEPLDTPREAGYNAQAGLLIRGKNAVLDNTLFKFDGDPNAQRFFGSISCSYLDDLLQEDEPLLTATRDGLDRSHSFVKALFLVGESFLEPFVHEEADRARRETHRTQNKELREKLGTALTRLNQIARDELADMDRVVDGPREPKEPESGFGFVPEYASILSGRRSSISLRALSRIIPEWSTATIRSDNPAVTVSDPTVRLEPREDFDWLCEARVSLEGVQVGAEAIITAHCEGLSCEALVRIIARSEPNERDTEPRRRGLFGEIRFSEESNPRQRVRYDRETKEVIIAVRHPSVSHYLRDRTGIGSDTAQGQVMLAELISEAVCQAIAQRGVETGRFATPVGNEEIAIQNQRLRLQNLYSGRIHEAIVNPEFRA